VPALAAAGGETIWIAGVGPMTGANSDLGQGLKRGINWAIEETNAAGGASGKKFSADFFDDEAKPEAAASAAQKIVSDPKYFAVIGHVNSSCTLAGLPIYARANLVEITGDSTNPTITKRGFKNFFRTIPTDAAQGPDMVNYAVKTLGKKNLAFIYENTDYGKGLVDASEPVVSKLGAKLLAKETYTLGVDKDFTAQLTKIKASKPDALFHYGNYGEGGPILNQAYRLGLTQDPNVAKLLAAGDQDYEIIKLAGADAIEGAYLFVFFNPSAKNPKAQAFGKMVMGKMNRLPTEYEAYNYEIVYVLKNAVEKGATRDTLANILHGLTFEGLAGTFKFDEYGDVVGKEQGLFIFKGGKEVPYS
jgi:branched-chain amino acid transport system substrate-binding protein